MSMWEQNIKVDEEKLFRLTGGKVHWLGHPAREMAARAITDFEDLGATPGQKFENVVSWLGRAIEYGREMGQEETERKWQSRIKKLFGL